MVNFRTTVATKIAQKGDYMSYYSKLLKDIIAVEKKAGKIILSAKNIERTNKLNVHDIVTQYDKAVQKVIFETLSKKYPHIKVIGEEENLGDKIDPYKGEVFIVDPIDGTSNFINGLNESAISIGYVVDGVPTVGVVYNPYRKELFTAIKGCGAKCNGQSINVNNLELKQGLVGYGTAVYYDELIQKTQKAFCDVLLKANDVRRIGSAALDICALAKGRFCAFYEMRLCPWDYAAGMVILTEAGGVITDIEGNPVSLKEKSSVCAGNNIAYNELKEILNS